MPHVSIRSGAASAKERLADLVTSAVWLDILEIVQAQSKGDRAALLTSLSLDENRRNYVLGKLHALAQLVRTTHEESGIELPERIKNYFEGKI